MTDAVSFGLFVKRHRERLKLSQEGLAKRLAHMGADIQQSQVSKIERGARPVSIQEALVLASILGLSLDALVPELVVYVCPVCNGAPPLGFTCNECHEVGK